MRVLKKTIWPHQIKLTGVGGNVDPRLQWLEEKLPRDQWYILAPNTYCFKTSDNALMFSLRWS
jgi:hypothetical protein